MRSGTDWQQLIEKLPNATNRDGRAVSDLGQEIITFFALEAQRQNLSITDLAGILNCSKQNVCQFFAGFTSPTLIRVEGIMRALRVNRLSVKLRAE